MPYGHSKTTYSGSRAPRYVWQPSFAPAARHRHRKGARPYHHHTDDLDLSDHFRRPWLHDYEPKNWKGGDYLDYLIQNDLRFAGMRFTLFLISKCLLLLELPIIAITYLIVAIGETERKRQVCAETSCKALRLGRRTSIHEPPTPERLREAWITSRTSLEGKLLLGSLISDIEPVVDRSYIRNQDGVIVGRRPGVKGWLTRHCPDLVAHYKALMSYKALADKMRLALGISDPDSLEESLVIAMKGQTPATGRTGGQTPQDRNVEERKEEGQTPQAAGNLAARDGENFLKSTARNYYDKALDKTVLHRSNIIREIIHGLKRPTMAMLEAALREKLGLVWMVRGRMRRHSA